MVELWKNALGHIFVHKICFLFIYVKTDGEEFVVADPCDQVVCFNKTPLLKCLQE